MLVMIINSSNINNLPTKWVNSLSRKEVIDINIDTGVYGSVGQPKASKPEVPDSTLGSSCSSLLFIKNSINDKSKHKKTFFTIVNKYIYVVLSWPVVYNMYKSMTS